MLFSPVCVFALCHTLILQRAPPDLRDFSLEGKGESLTSSTNSGAGPVASSHLFSPPVLDVCLSELTTKQTKKNNSWLLQNSLPCKIPPGPAGSCGSLLGPGSGCAWMVYFLYSPGNSSAGCCSLSLAKEGFNWIPLGLCILLGSGAQIWRFYKRESPPHGQICVRMG